MFCDNHHRGGIVFLHFGRMLLFYDCYCMWLVRQTKVKLDPAREIVVGHLCYSAAKVWNAALYERIRFLTGHGKIAPDLHSQTISLQSNIFFLQLGMDIAIEVLKKVEWSWKSYLARKKINENEARLPRYKGDDFICVIPKSCYSCKGNTVIVALSQVLKNHMKKRFNIDVSSLILENNVFPETENIAHVELHAPLSGACRVDLLYRKNEEPVRPDNERYLAIDLGIRNPVTMCSPSTDEVLILGREWLECSQYFAKQIARYQILDKNKDDGRRFNSKKVAWLYEKRNNKIKEILNIVTRYIVSYALDNSINTVIVGNLNGIRINNDKGKRINQMIHSFPYDRFYKMLGYKLKMMGVQLVMIDESFTSQCSPYSKAIDKEHAEKERRIKRGLYQDPSGANFNADAVGAWNIYRKYVLQKGGFVDYQDLSMLSHPKVIHFPVIPGKC